MKMGKNFLSNRLYLLILFFLFPACSNAGEFGFAQECSVTRFCSPGYECDFNSMRCIQEGSKKDLKAQPEKEREASDEEPRPFVGSSLNAAMADCQAKISAANDSCDENKDSSMSQVMNGASKLTLAGGQFAAMSVQQSCSDMASLLQGANAALAAYRMTCAYAVKACDRSCNIARKAALANADSQGVEDANKAIRNCLSLSEKANEANNAIQNFGQSMRASAQCAAFSAANSAQALLCAKQPNTPGCSDVGAVDCSNPQVASTNQICICSKNPNDPACRSSGNSRSGVSNSRDFGPGGSGDFSSRLQNNADIPGDLGGGERPDLPVPEQRDVGNMAGQPIDGKQGGSAVLGGGDSSGGSGGGSGGGVSSGMSQDTVSSSGFYGGGGRQGAGSYPGGSSSGGESGNYGSPQNPNNPDLRKFLPGGQYDPRRGISGVSGPDGIAGPHSSIWQNIKNRYQTMAPMLMP